MISIRQMRSVVAVLEEGSFTRAAERENATQSGISQHVSAVEQQLGAALFERTSDGVVPTKAGQRYYRRCVEMLRTMELASAEVQALSGEVAGTLRAGLMPAFTRAALAPALERFCQTNPHVDVRITEAYSGALTDLVRADELDFALVPASGQVVGVKTSLLSRDREMLVSGAGTQLDHLKPVRLATLPPLKIIVPGAANIRRRNLESYFETNNVRIERLLEMDAMFGTLELIARSDWVAVLPGIITISDARGDLRNVNPLADPELLSEFVVIEPARRALSTPAALFLDQIRREIQEIAEQWRHIAN